MFFSSHQKNHFLTASVWIGPINKQFVFEEVKSSMKVPLVVNYFWKFFKLVFLMLYLEAGLEVNIIEKKILKYRVYDF